MKRILVSIVSHGQQDLVQKLLVSIDNFVCVEDWSIQIVVTENFSSSVDVISSRFPLDTTINLRQKGFGLNHNCAFERFECDYFCIVNPDVEFVHMVDFDILFNKILAERFSICSPVVIDKHGEIEDFRRADLTLFNFLKRRITKNRIEDFDWFAGIFLIIASQTFRDLNGFDTRFFMYVEDCDLGMRARQGGLRVGELESIYVVHDERRATTVNLNHLKWHVTSLLKYWFRKYFFL